MERADRLQEALGLFRGLEIEVRHAHLGGEGGGLCRVRGRRILFVDVDADGGTILDRCVDALASLAEVDDMYVSPALRELIADAGREAKG